MINYSQSNLIVEKKSLYKGVNDFSMKNFQI